MNRIKKILVPFDFSDCANNALEYIKSMTKTDNDISLFLLYVNENPDHTSNKKFKSKLAVYVDRLKRDTEHNYEFSVMNGSLVTSILDAQKTIKADLIVMGTNGAPLNERDFTNTAEVASNTICPLLAVPINFKKFKLKAIAIGLDKNQLDPSFSIETIQDFARWFDAKVHLLTIKNDKDNATQIMSPELESRFEYYFQTLDFNFAFENATDIEQGIENYTKKNDIDLFAIMPRNHISKGEPSKAKLTVALTKHTQVPLLVTN